jgi:hypothetical protein
MGCRSDYLAPNTYETESRKACKNFVYLASILGKPIPRWITEGAEDVYGSINKMHEITVMLCELCRQADDSIIYNGRCREARRLADWWDDHKEADKARDKSDHD